MALTFFGVRGTSVSEAPAAKGLCVLAGSAVVSALLAFGTSRVRRPPVVTARFTSKNEGVRRAAFTVTSQSADTGLRLRVTPLRPNQVARADPLRQMALGRSRPWWQLSFRGQAPPASAGSSAPTLGLTISLSLTSDVHRRPRHA